MNLRLFSELIRAARIHWFAVAVACLLGTLAGAGIGALLPVSYTASSRLFIAAPDWNESTAMPNPLAAGEIKSFGDSFTHTRIISYQRLVDSPRLAAAVVDKLGLQTSPDELSGRLSARAVPDTVMLDVYASAATPEESVRLADTAANELSNLIKAVETPSSQKKSPIQPVLIQPAELPSGPASPRTLLNVLCGAVVGFLLGLTFASIRERGSLAGMPQGIIADEKTLGVLPILSDAPTFVDLDDVGQDTAQDARYLCLRLLTELDAADASTMLFAPPRASEAAGSAAVLLAAAMAELDYRVVIVLANFADHDDAGTEVGLGDVLDGRQPLSAAIRLDRAGKIGYVMPGRTNASSIAALAGRAMDAVVSELETQFDYVVVVGRPVLESVDTLEIAGKVDTAILICPLPGSSNGEIAESERLLANTPATALGRVVVLGREAGDDALATTSSATDRRAQSSQILTGE